MYMVNDAIRFRKIRIFMRFKNSYYTFQMI